MRFSQWFVGLAATGAIAGAVASGCSSSSKTSPPADSGPEMSGDSGGDGAVCAPEQLTPIPADAGGLAPACSSCVMTKCVAAVSECNTDCTCGSNLNPVLMCLEMQSPAEAGAADAGGAGALGGLGGLFGGGGAGGGALTCFEPLALSLLGGGGATGGLGALTGLLGAAGGGGATDGAAPATTGNATVDVLTCLAMTCGCLGALPGMEAGAPEAGAGAEAGTGDATGDVGTSGDGAGGDSSSGDGSSDAAGQ